jgi:hypothetical protein
MTHQEKINYMRIAAGICGFGFNNQQLDLLVSLYELTIEKEEKTDLMSIAKIEQECKERANTKHKQNLLDKISDKTSGSSVHPKQK